MGVQVRKRSTEERDSAFRRLPFKHSARAGNMILGIVMLVTRTLTSFDDGSATEIRH